MTQDSLDAIERAADLEAQKLRVVERTWETGDLCGDCPHYHSWTEHHGPGLFELMADCRILESGDYDQCPGVIAWAKLEREE